MTRSLVVTYSTSEADGATNAASKLFTFKLSIDIEDEFMNALLEFSDLHVYEDIELF